MDLWRLYIIYMSNYVYCILRRGHKPSGNLSGVSCTSEWEITGMCSIEHLQWKSLCEISIKKLSDVGVTAMGINRQRAYCPTDRLHCPIRQRRMLEEYNTGESLLWEGYLLNLWDLAVHRRICNLLLVYAFIFHSYQKNYPGLLSSYRVAFKW